jgi:uncharacterized membrane protein
MVPSKQEGEGRMATLTVWKFSTAEGAADAERILDKLVKQELISVHDAAIVSWPTGARKPKTKQLNNLTGVGALGGAFWGLLFGLLFFIPLLGAAVGAGLGAMTGAMADVGIDDDFIKSVRDQVTPGTSALFLLTSDAVRDRVKAAYDEQGGPRATLVHTNLSKDEEAALRQAFEDE